MDGGPYAAWLAYRYAVEILPMSTVDSLQQNIFRAIARRIEVPIRIEDSFALLGLDSVGMAELSFELEREFEVRLDEEIAACQTVGDLVEYVRQRCTECGSRSNHPRQPR